MNILLLFLLSFRLLESLKLRFGIDHFAFRDG